MRPIPNRRETDAEPEDSPLTIGPDSADSESEADEDDESWIEAQEF